MARACGHTHLQQFSADNITTWKLEMAHLTGIKYGGALPPSVGKSLGEQIGELAQLHEAGALTAEEFTQAKLKLLA